MVVTYCSVFFNSIGFERVQIFQHLIFFPGFCGVNYTSKSTIVKLELWKNFIKVDDDDEIEIAVVFFLFPFSPF